MPSLSSSALTKIARDPLMAIAKAGLVTLIAFCIGTLAPSLVAHHSGVFYPSQFMKTVRQRNLQDVKAHDERVAHISMLIDQNEARLQSDVSHGLSNDLAATLAMRSYLAGERSKLDNELAFHPFYLNPLMYMWSVGYASLGILVFVLAPERYSRKRKPTLLAFGAISFPYLFFQGPVWLRNFALNNEGRRVYNFANFDISKATYFAQEINILLLFIFLAFLWSLWQHYIADTQVHIAELKSNKAIAELSALVSSEFFFWQICSIVLLAGFLVYTDEYWILLVRAGDSRYLVSAITIHAVWGVTWTLLSLPVLSAWAAWHDLRQNMLLDIVACSEEEAERRLTLLQEISPVPFWNAVGSGFVAVGSFVLPLLKPYL